VNVNAIEALWLGINLVSLVVTITNVVDAWRVWRVMIGTTLPHEIQARANVRREAVRLVIVACLIAIAVPAALRPGDVALTLPLALLMVIPIGVAINGYLDRRTRRSLARLVVGDDLAEAILRSEALRRMERTVDDTAVKVDDIHRATVDEGDA